jgi:hypothetical protein
MARDRGGSQRQSWRTALASGRNRHLELVAEGTAYSWILAIPVLLVLRRLKRGHGSDAE